MLKPGVKIIMTKGYKGTKGVIEEKTDSKYEFYILKLENGIYLVAGPESFSASQEDED